MAELFDDDDENIPPVQLPACLLDTNAICRPDPLQAIPEETPQVPIPRQRIVSKESRLPLAVGVLDEVVRELAEQEPSTIPRSGSISLDYDSDIEGWRLALSVVLDREEGDMVCSELLGVVPN